MSISKESNKTDRLYIRASKSEKELLERAAEITHTSRSQFVLTQALNAAERIVADQTRFVLPEATWNAFCERLERPALELPNVKAIANEPSPFRER